MREFLRHFFLPHHTNNHRAKALHPDALLVYVFLFSLFNFGVRYAHKQFPNVLGYATDIRVEQLLVLTNQKRMELGLTPLTLNPTLSQAAGAKAQDMFSSGYWAHKSPTGKTPWDFIIASGYKYTLAGENLAKNFSTSQGVVDAWMASPTHKDNIVKAGYRDIGFAVVNGVLNGEETTLVVQMFGTGGSPITSLPLPAPKVEVVPQETEELAMVPQSAATRGIVEGTSQKVLNAFSQVITNPRINIPTMTRDVVFLFIGLLVGIFILDGIIVSRKHVVRVTGHTLAHVLFLSAVTAALLAVQRGALI